MTVLGGDQARGLGAGAARKYLVGVAVAIVGLAAAFGVSRVIEGEEPAVYSGPIVERSMAMQESVDTLTEGARAQSGDAASPSGWTLEQELAQIQAGSIRPATNGAPASKPGGPR